MQGDETILRDNNIESGNFIKQKLGYVKLCYPKG